MSELLSSGNGSLLHVARYFSSKKRGERDPLFIPLYAQEMIIAVLVLDERFQQAYYSGPAFTGIEILLSRFTPLVQNARLSQELALKNAYLQEVNARLTEVDRLKDQFITTTCHELRTPFTSIIGFLELLDTSIAQLSPEAQRKYLYKMRRACNALSDQFDVIYESGLLEYEKERMKLVPTSLNAVVDDAISKIEGLLLAQQRELYVDLPADITIMADARLMRIVVINLLSNAIKYSAIGTPVSITGTLQQNMVTVAVKDYGLGIPSGSQEILFERFVRLERDLISPVRGAGLGLSISKQLINAMEGDIWFESSGVSGEGSTFYFKLHLYSGEERPENAEGVLGRSSVSSASIIE